MAELSALVESLVNGEAEEVRELTQKALDQGVPPGKILNDGLKSGMGFVQEEFRKGEFPMPKLLLAAKAMRAAMDILRPSLVSCGVRPIGKVALGTVKDDTHDFGKNIISVMLEGAGFEVHDLGVNVPPERFIKAAEDGADIIAIYVLRNAALVYMEATVKILKKAGLGRSRILLTGTPVSESFASRIGADGYSQSAAGAVEKAKELVGSASSQ